MQKIKSLIAKLFWHSFFCLGALVISSSQLLASDDRSSNCGPLIAKLGEHIYPDANAADAAFTRLYEYFGSESGASQALKPVAVVHSGFEDIEDPHSLKGMIVEGVRKNTNLQIERFRGEVLIVYPRDDQYYALLRSEEPQKTIEVQLTGQKDQKLFFEEKAGRVDRPFRRTFHPNSSDADTAYISALSQMPYYLEGKGSFDLFLLERDANLSDFRALEGRRVSGVFKPTENSVEIFDGVVVQVYPSSHRNYARILKDSGESVLFPLDALKQNALFLSTEKVPNSGSLLVDFNKTAEELPSGSDKVEKILDAKMSGNTSFELVTDSLENLSRVSYTDIPDPYALVGLKVVGAYSLESKTPEIVSGIVEGLVSDQHHLSAMVRRSDGGLVSIRVSGPGRNKLYVQKRNNQARLRFGEEVYPDLSYADSGFANALDSLNGHVELFPEQFSDIPRADDNKWDAPEELIGKNVLGVHKPRFNSTELFKGVVVAYDVREGHSFLVVRREDGGLVNFQLTETTQTPLYIVN